MQTPTQNSTLRSLLPVSGLIIALGLSVLPSIVQAAPKPEVEALTVVGKSVFKSDEIIPLSLRVTNTSDHKVTLNFNTGQKFDFFVFRMNEPAPLYKWSQGRLFTMAMGTLELGKGKSQLFPAKLKTGPLAPGKYKLVGMLKSQPSISAPVVRFEIVN